MTTAVENSRLEGMGMTAVARGAAHCSDLSTVRARRPSFYADPVSWLVAESVEHAMGECAEDVRAAADAVGAITLSDHCTVRTMREISSQATSGRLSPLRFSGANPAAAGSLPGILFGFKGPSLTLSTPPTHGLPAALVAARSWLALEAATYVVLNGHVADSGDCHAVWSVIVRAHDAEGRAVT
ncbi:coronafacic acid synthetase [Streptomyces xiangluensis]|uniref:Coronafacic acid synthetase n=1 Tax=Streptomyces xiangluensis TaxID=2665720 RepID=A0ABV8YN46_9ACTN